MLQCWLSVDMGRGFNDDASSLPTLCPDGFPHSYYYQIQSELEPWPPWDVVELIGSQCEQDPIWDCPDRTVHASWPDWMIKVALKLTRVNFNATGKEGQQYVVSTKLQHEEQ